MQQNILQQKALITAMKNREDNHSPRGQNKRSERLLVQDRILDIANARGLSINELPSYMPEIKLELAKKAFFTSDDILLDVIIDLSSKYRRNNNLS
jgi:hypothetical protein